MWGEEFHAVIIRVIYQTSSPLNLVWHNPQVKQIPFYESLYHFYDKKRLKNISTMMPINVDRVLPDELSNT